MLLVSFVKTLSGLYEKMLPPKWLLVAVSIGLATTVGAIGF